MRHVPGKAGRMGWVQRIAFISRRANAKRMPGGERRLINAIRSNPIQRHGAHGEGIHLYRRRAWFQVRRQPFARADGRRHGALAPRRRGNMLHLAAKAPCRWTPRSSNVELHKATMPAHLMPIEFYVSEGRTRVRQSFVSPSVYLDHWALRLFSDEAQLQDRLVTTLQRQGGTLLLSNFSFAEFARDDDRRHTIAAEEFIERLLPNIFLTDFAIDKVHEQEQQEHDNVRRFWPPADLPQLKLFAERAKDASLGFTMRGFIAMARDNYEPLEKVTKDTLHMIRVGLETHRADPEYVRAARNVRPTSKRTRTSVVMAELMREFILDPHSPLSDNDIMDMIHAVLPVNCCDFVLLDGAWENRVSKMKQRIQGAGAAMPVASCYSRRNDGVLRFLEDLANYSGGSVQ